MSRIAYVNGRYLPHIDAAVHIEDRGYQFADGVYDVVAIRNGRLIDCDLHLDRFDYSLAQVRIAPPMSRSCLIHVLHQVIRANGIKNGILYIQATRGVARRDHPFPKAAKPSLVVTAKRMKPIAPSIVENGVSVALVPDLRWRRCDIKSISLLPNILAKQAAREAGAYEAWLVDENGFITEGSSTNAWIVTQQGEIVTYPAEAAILNGITRRVILDLAAREGMSLSERPFSVEDALNAKEAFLTSTTSFVLPIVKIDDKKVGNGKPGPIALTLRRLCEAAAEEQSA